MFVERPSLSVRPLLYDALSQEFTPGTDSRRHTIGRLAVATFQKGEFEWIEDRITGLSLPRQNEAVFTYTPSWTPNVLCTAYAGDISDNRALMRGIHLYHDAHQRKLEFYSKPDAVVDVLTIDTGESATTHELELGERLHSARDAVAAAATEFFAEN